MAIDTTARGKYKLKGEQDQRLSDKPMHNDGSLPVMRYFWDDMPETCMNIWHAHMAGWPRILTYDYVADTARKRRLMSSKRYYNLTASGVPSNADIWRDEYPFASTVENGGSTFVGHAPKYEQIAQGELISAFYSQWGAERHSAENRRCFYFEVKVYRMPSRAYAATRARASIDDM